jgi:micrococcal nuclease
MVLLCWTLAVQPSDIEVIDGDTVRVKVRVWDDVVKLETVRVLGVNSPERGQPGYDDAKAYTSEWIRADEVRLLYCGKRDKYGRALATLSRQGSVLAQELIRRGLGRPQ